MKTILTALLFLAITVFGVASVYAQFSTMGTDDTHIVVNETNKEQIQGFPTAADLPFLEVTKREDVKCMVTLWNHRRDLEISDLVEELGTNFIWSHDDAYEGQAWEDTHMHKLLQIPGVDHVLAKIERAAWGWTQEMSLRHARWVALLSQMHDGIFGLYLNDFYDEIEDGYRTEEQWREIIAAAKNINPDLKTVAPHYPHREQGRHPYDFDIDGVILNLWGNDPQLIARAEEHIAAGLEHHPDRFVFAGLYLSAGNPSRWLTEEEFKNTLRHFVDLVNQGKLAGLRMFSAGQFKERPEYIGWAKEVLAGLTCR